MVPVKTRFKMQIGCNSHDWCSIAFKAALTHKWTTPQPPLVLGAKIDDAATSAVATVAAEVVCRASTNGGLLCEKVFLCCWGEPACFQRQPAIPLSLSLSLQQPSNASTKTHLNSGVTVAGASGLADGLPGLTSGCGAS